MRTDIVPPVFGIVGALKVLPRVLTEVQRIAEFTATLPRVEKSIDRVAEDTAVLPGMYERMAAIEEAMPTLVDVQRRLADLPGTMEHLEGEMGGLGETLKQRYNKPATILPGTLERSYSPAGRYADGSSLV